MAIIYQITVEQAEKEAGKENLFRITWYNIGANTEDFFEQSAREIMQDETWKLWQNHLNQLNIGRELFYFLDDDSRHLQRALVEASQQGESLHLHLHTCSQVADWPFELLAQEDTFLLPYRLHLVHRVSEWGVARDLPPKNRRLKLLFMACSALDVKPELNFEKSILARFQVLIWMRASLRGGGVSYNSWTPVMMAFLWGVPSLSLNLNCFFSGV